LKILLNTKLHALALVVVIICEFVGITKIPLGKFTIVLLPMLFAMIIGGLISYPKFKILQESEMNNASSMLSVCLVLMISVLGLGIGPKIPQLMDAKLALLLQEFGHLLGTIIFGLPLAMILGMRRETIGATYSLDREANIAIIAERYGLNSPEGHGVMAMYVCGTVFGAVWIGVLASFVAGLNIFHPLALGMGSGIGSGSMLAAASGAIAEIYPEFRSQILAYATASNLIVSIFGIYFAMFVSLPLTIKLYNFFDRFRKTEVKTDVKVAQSEAQADNKENSSSKTEKTGQAPKPNALQKICDFVLLALLSGLFVVVGHVIGYKNVNVIDSLLGICLIVEVGAVGFGIAQIPYLNKIPSIAWISATAVLVSSAIFPGNEMIVSIASKIPFLAVTTVVLSYAGLSIGKDLAAFKTISWKIIPVALVAIGGVFICATTIAQLALTFSGNI